MKQKDGFLDMLVSTGAANLLENMLACKEVVQAGEKQLEQVRIFKRWQIWR